MSHNMLRSEDDELDCLLDNALEEFERPVPSKPSGKPTESDVPETTLDDTFISQLAADMETLFKSAATTESASGEGDVQQTIADLFKSMTNTNTAPFAHTAQTQSTTSVAPETKLSFEEAIASTMNKLETSSKEADVKLSEELKTAGQMGPNLSGIDGMNLDEQSMAKMMKELESMMDSPEFSNMFDNMVTQLLSKDILYEPMKELSAKYPEWIAKNKLKLSIDELKRYTEQMDVVNEILMIYDKYPEGKEPDEADGQKIVDLMQKMQETGNPPDEIMSGMTNSIAGLGNVAGASAESVPPDCSIM